MDVQRWLAGLVEKHQLSEELLQNTVRRHEVALAEMVSGYEQSMGDFLAKTFPHFGDGPVVCWDIPFSSLCQHHLLPFYGLASVGYRPSGRVIGLSKVGRIVQVLSQRLQLQEKLTQEIAATIARIEPAPRGVGVYVRAEHSCVACRGVRARSVVGTFAQIGEFDMSLLKH